MRFLGGKGGYFEKWSNGSKTSDMTSKGLGEVFEGDSTDMCAGKFPLVLMGGRANGQACADGERGPPTALAEISELFSKKLFHWHQWGSSLPGLRTILCIYFLNVSAVQVSRVGFLKVYRQASTLFLFHCCTDSSTFCALAAWTGQYILEEVY
jgi:hypothetical protein